MLQSDGARFSVEVTDSASGDVHHVASVHRANGVGPVELLEGDPDSMDDSLGLLLITSLVDDVKVIAGAGGAIVRMSWPAGES
jgi:hypothetical protein